MIIGQTHVPTELLGGLVKGAKVRAMYVVEVPGSNPRASHFISMVVTPAIIGWRLLYVAVVSRYGGSSARFGGVLSYIFFDFLVMGPPWVFRGCHVVPDDWDMWNPLIGPPCR
jgi:hypothetical protein